MTLAGISATTFSRQALAIENALLNWDFYILEQSKCTCILHLDEIWNHFSEYHFTEMLKTRSLLVKDLESRF